ncbi:ankyrin repeat-containing domain protein [Aspergillus germanicus]
MPELSTIPAECLLVIADHIPKDQDLNSLAQTSRRSHAILNHYLYRRTVRSGDPKTTICTFIKTANIGALRHWIKARGDVNTLVDGDSLLMQLIAGRHFTRRYFDRLRNEGCWKLLPKRRTDRLRVEVEKLRVQETQRMKTYYAIAELLLNTGADIHEPTTAGQPLLHVAALAGDEEMVRLLVARGADVRSMTKRGNTALHAAALGANTIPILQFLLDHGAGTQIQTQTVDGITPLRGAIYAKCKENAAFLLRNGAGAAYKERVNPSGN